MTRLMAQLARKMGRTQPHSMGFENWLQYCVTVQPETKALVQRIRTRFLGAC